VQGHRVTEWSSKVLRRRSIKILWLRQFVVTIGEIATVAGAQRGPGADSWNPKCPHLRADVNLAKADSRSPHPGLDSRVARKPSSKPSLSMSGVDSGLSGLGAGDGFGQRLGLIG
jgi:hypothetical protein